MKDSIETQTIKKILMIRLSSIGDVLLTTPAIRLLKKKFPESRIDFVIKKEFAELLMHNPGIHRLLIFDKQDKSHSISKIRKQIRNEKYDLIIDLHKNFRSFYLTLLSKADQIFRYKKNAFRRFFLVKCKLNFYKTIVPVYLRYIARLKKLQIVYDEEGLDLFFNNDIKIKILEKFNDFLNIPGKYTIGIAPGAKHATKQWMPEGFAAVIQHYTKAQKSKIIIFGSSVDQNVVQSFKINKNQNVLDTTGKLSLLETGVLINQCDLVVTNDSGLTHLASALKKKIVAIFGSTTEEFGFFPYTTEYIVIQNNNLRCRPCSHIGKHKCPKKHFKCMKDIIPTQVIGAIDRLLDD